VDAVPPGGGSFLAASADELVTFQPSAGLRIYESATVAEQTPLFDTVAPRTFTTGARLGVDHSWEADAVGVESRLDYAAVDGALRPDGTPAGPQRQIVAGGVGIWRHDWGRFFSSRAEAGAVRAQRLNTGFGRWEPVGTAALVYVSELADAELSYRHAITMNPLLGLSLVVNEVRLRGAVPLTKKGEVFVAASAGYQQGRILDDSERLAAHVDAALADVGVGWQTTNYLLLGVRYQHIEQMSDMRTPPLPVSFVRNTIMLGATLRYPPESDMPRAYRAPRRVDGKDEIRDTTGPTAPRERGGGAGT
jgi:hypothetical protein